MPYLYGAGAGYGYASPYYGAYATPYASYASPYYYGGGYGAYHGYGYGGYAASPYYGAYGAGFGRGYGYSSECHNATGNTTHCIAFANDPVFRFPHFWQHLSLDKRPSVHFPLDLPLNRKRGNVTFPGVWGDLRPERAFHDVILVRDSKATVSVLY